MQRSLAVTVVVIGGPARPDDPTVRAIIDRAPQVTGGEEELARAAIAATWRG